jgi:hypothetical protein
MDTNHPSSDKAARSELRLRHGEVPFEASARDLVFRSYSKLRFEKRHDARLSELAGVDSALGLQLNLCPMNPA